jgi:hypothetical protein
VANSVEILLFMGSYCSEHTSRHIVLFITFNTSLHQFLNGNISSEISVTRKYKNPFKLPVYKLYMTNSRQYYRVNGTNTSEALMKGIHSSS